MKTNKLPTAADNLVQPPSAAAYKAAFLACRDKKLMTDKQLAMLKANYNAPNHTLTAGELAAQVGFQTYSAASLQYGKYAGNLCSKLGLTPSVQLAALVSFSDGEQPGDEFMRWTLLDPVARALEQLGWVRRS